MCSVITRILRAGELLRFFQNVREVGRSRVLLTRRTRTGRRVQMTRNAASRRQRNFSLTERFERRVREISGSGYAGQINLVLKVSRPLRADQHIILPYSAFNAGNRLG